MGYLLLLSVFALLSGCVTAQRYNTGTVQSQLEARAQEYQQAQEQRVHTVGAQLLQQIPNPPELALIIVPEGSLYAGTTYGRLVITTGMVRFAATDDELAVILGHEMAHHTQGHVVRGTVSTIAIGILASVADYYAHGAGRSVQTVGQGLYNHYNQSQELEADAVGLRYAASAGYDPRAGAAVWERLAIEAPSTLSTSFFASHPSSPERMQAAQAQAQMLMAQGYTPAPHSSAQEGVVAAVPVAYVPPAPVPLEAPSPAMQIWGMMPYPAMLNVVSQSDIQLRAAETEYRAGRMSLKEFREIRRSLYPQWNK